MRRKIAVGVLSGLLALASTDAALAGNKHHKPGPPKPMPPKCVPASTAGYS